MCSSTLIVPAMLGPVLPPYVPEIRAIAIMTANGAATVNGSSHALGNSTDTALLNALRNWADVVLVGASTVIKENYSGVKIPSEISAKRVSAGQSAVPPLAILSNSLKFSPTAKIFRDTTTPPLFLTSSHKLGADFNNQKLSDITAAGGKVINYDGDSIIDAVTTLRQLGFNRIVCEGGPAVYRQIFNSPLVDVFHLTIAPYIAWGKCLPLFSPEEVASQSNEIGDVYTPLTLEYSQVSQDGHLFLRYRRGVSASQRSGE